MRPAHTPVKVLLTDGINQTGAGAMKDFALIHLPTTIALLHLLLLPAAKTFTELLLEENFLNGQSDWSLGIAGIRLGK